MSDSEFDYDKIKDMEYDPYRERYIGKDGSEFVVTPKKDGSGYKYDYYDTTTYGNAKHNSTHIRSDLNENWTSDRNDRDNGTKEHTEGSGCYLTTACMQHMSEDFDDSCDELMTLRWFRNQFVPSDDIQHYYEAAPKIVEKINSLQDKNKVYSWIYENVVEPCVKAIKNNDYDFAYKRYKSSVLVLEKEFINIEHKTMKLKKSNN